MIKVNYDPKTGKVIAFNKDIEPYIEITEEARKQPLPNKYSWYAVENNKFRNQKQDPNRRRKSKGRSRSKASGRIQSPRATHQRTGRRP